MPVTFSAFNEGLRENLQEVVNRMQYSKPTPIQAYTIPAVLAGRDVFATAQTGSGKTVSIVQSNGSIHSRRRSCCRF